MSSIIEYFEAHFADIELSEDVLPYEIESDELKIVIYEKVPGVPNASPGDIYRMTILDKRNGHDSVSSIVYYGVNDYKVLVPLMLRGDDF